MDEKEVFVLHIEKHFAFFGALVFLTLAMLLSAKPVHASYLAWWLATDGGSLTTTSQTPALDARARSLSVKPGKVPGTTTESDEKVVYLTFDDGPSANTQPILDILDRYNIKATFFVTDQYPQYAGMIKKAYDKGHTIGLHSSTHQYSIYASPQTYFADLDKIGQTVKSQIGFVPAFVRFPGGSSNTVSRHYAAGIMTTLAAELNNRGYQYYDWNADSTDGAAVNGEVDTIVAHALACNDNNIVLLCHDAAPKTHTVEALPRIIEGYQQRGYVFRAITRKSYAPHHAINN